MRKIRSVDAFTHQGFAKPNLLNKGSEDTFAVRDNTFFAVIDGATSMVAHDMDGLTPAAYLARFITRCVNEMQGPMRDDVTAADVFMAINSAFRLFLRAAFPDVAAEGKYGPSAAAAMVKLHADGTYTYAQVADCFIVEVRTDGTLLLVTPDQLVGVDNGSMASARQRLRDGVPPEEILADPKVRAILKENRLKNNVVFGVLNGEPEVQNLLCHGRRSLDGVAALVVLSDGMVIPGEGGRTDGAEAAAQRMLHTGVSAHWNALKALYDTDPTFRRFLRFKHMDDATGLVVRFA
jgi:hypothetical protein